MGDAGVPPGEAGWRAAFAALVALQDGGAGVAASRARVAAEFGLRDEELDRVEEAGMAGNWPPLDAPAPKRRGKK